MSFSTSGHVNIKIRCAGTSVSVLFDYIRLHLYICANFGSVTATGLDMVDLQLGMWGMCNEGYNVLVLRTLDDGVGIIINRGVQAVTGVFTCAIRLFAGIFGAIMGRVCSLPFVGFFG